MQPNNLGSIQMLFFQKKLANVNKSTNSVWKLAQSGHPALHLNYVEDETWSTSKQQQLRSTGGTIRPKLFIQKFRLHNRIYKERNAQNKITDMYVIHL
jgi:hypothetical protein